MNFCDGESVIEFYCLSSSLQNGELLGTHGDRSHLASKTVGGTHELFLPERFKGICKM